MSFSNFEEAKQQFSQHGSSINSMEIKNLIDLGATVEKFQATTIENGKKYNDDGIVFSFNGEEIYFVRDNFQDYFSSFDTGYKKVDNENVTNVQKNNISVNLPKNQDELSKLNIVTFVSQFKDDDIIKNFSKDEIESSYKDSQNYKLKIILDKINNGKKRKVKFKR